MNSESVYSGMSCYNCCFVWPLTCLKGDTNKAASKGGANKSLVSVLNVGEVIQPFVASQRAVCLSSMSHFGAHFLKGGANSSSDTSVFSLKAVPLIPKVTT